jgi:hypothetical protein
MTEPDDSLAPWLGALVNCSSDQDCVDAAGGNVSGMLLTCSWVPGQVEGVPEVSGSYCACMPFRGGPGCTQIEAGMTAKGLALLPLCLLFLYSSCLGVRALWYCPRSARCSPGVLCLALNVCVTMVGAANELALCLVRLDGGNSAFITFFIGTATLFVALSNGLAMYMSMIFEAVLCKVGCPRWRRWQWWWCGLELRV